MDLAVEDQPRKSHRPISFGSVEAYFPHVEGAIFGQFCQRP
jgi:hypothetical protein